MTVLVAGTVRVPPENLERFRPHMQAMLAAQPKYLKPFTQRLSLWVERPTRPSPLA